MIRLANSPRHYQWGSTTGISDLLGTRPSGRPEAELWFGTHGASPTWLVDHTDGYATLNEYVYANPRATVAHGDTVPFLLKVLAAGEPLSLQAHPSSEQARAGFARENAAGLSFNDSRRNYRDDQPKPELIVAVSEQFVALSGFRPLNTTLRLFDEIAQLSASSVLAGFIDNLRSSASQGTKAALEWALDFSLRMTDTAAPCVVELVELTSKPRLDENEIALTVRDLAKFHPRDSGVLVAALLNRVVLARGEALYLPAGNIHAYVRGVGIELMNASDNVLRGGLTVKNVDVDELTHVADFTELVEPRLAPSKTAPGLTLFAPDDASFRLSWYQGSENSDQKSVPLEINNCAILLCTAGALTVTSAVASLAVRRGEAVFISVNESDVTINGSGEAFIATASTPGK